MDSLNGAKRKQLTHRRPVFHQQSSIRHPKESLLLVAHDDYAFLP
jgi:hypothetical protein